MWGWVGGVSVCVSVCVRVGEGVGGECVCVSVRACGGGGSMCVSVSVCVCGGGGGRLSVWVGVSERKCVCVCQCVCVCVCVCESLNERTLVINRVKGEDRDKAVPFGQFQFHCLSPLPVYTATHIIVNVR